MYTIRIILIVFLFPVSETSSVFLYATYHYVIDFLGKPNKTCNPRKMRRKEISFEEMYCRRTTFATKDSFDERHRILCDEAKINSFLHTQ
jgi:CRISPR/Cas system CMR subunit Cmr4 (Cas7 group RAMP superfamily)